MNNIFYLIVFFILLIFISYLLKRIINNNSNVISSYKIRSKLLTSAERSFYGVLLNSVLNNAIVMSKVRVADVLIPSVDKSKYKKQWWSAFNKIAKKHFDFVLCNPKDMSVLAVIELDDKSHNNSRTTKRDVFLNDACESANLRLIRFKASSSYNINEVRNKIFSEGH